MDGAKQENVETSLKDGRAKYNRLHACTLLECESFLPTLREEERTLDFESDSRLR
jgi:hypothetical protein